ncbi:MAG: glycosyltransferase family 2 protein [Bacteriovorax sp.]|nr:glycosyltransferase family 2 protein [Bacteriovorax sp.]
MQNKRYITVALPAYNEAKNLPALLEKFQEINCLYHSLFETRVLVINDSSNDDTVSVLNSLLPKLPNLKVDVIHHEVNRGLTGGINTAFDYFHKIYNSEHPPIAAGLMDGDNSHSPSILPTMVSKILEDYDVVIASRFRPGARVEGVSAFRQVLSFGLTCLFKILRNLQGVRDYSCGYRLYSKRIVNLVKARHVGDVVLEKSFASMVEILLKCDLEGALMTEVPFLLRYDLKLGESKMPFKKTILGNLRLLTTLRKYK